MGQSLNLFLAFLWVICLAPQAAAQSSTVPISEVQLTLTRNQQTLRVAGKLYRVDLKASDRVWAADVAQNGKLSNAIRCNQQDHFEAEIVYAVAFPDDPIRVRCATILSFSFTRPSFAFNSKFKTPFLDVASTDIDVRGLAELGMIAKTTGNAPLERAASDSVISATAVWLGDSQLDKYVERNAALGYKLGLNRRGLAALRLKQLNLKIKPTGELDKATQDAVFLSTFQKTAKQVGNAFCTVKSNAVTCTTDEFPTTLDPRSQVNLKFRY